MIVVTAGSAFLDIDAFAGCIAYAELLNLQGRKAIAVSSAPLNKSVTPDIRSKLQLDTYAPKEGDQFVLIDVSNAAFFDPIVDQKAIIEVIDHHPGHEQYWAERLHNKAHIEPIGAACTLVYERYVADGLTSKMPAVVAEALAVGILDNTLNFTAEITSERDKTAYKKLLSIAGKDETLASGYFSACQAAIEAELEEAILNDMKHITETTYLPTYVGQLVVWDAKALLEREVDRMVTCMNTIGSEWCVNVISIADGKSYILASTSEAKAKMSRLYDLIFTGFVGAPMPAQLRKEILKRAITLELKSEKST